MARVKSFVDSGSLLPADLNSIEDDYEFGFSTWKNVATRSGQLPSALALPSTGVLPNGDGIAQPVALVNSAAYGSGAHFWFDPADWTAGGRAVRVRFRVLARVGDVAPAQPYVIQFGLTDIWTASAHSPVMSHNFGSNLTATILSATLAANAVVPAVSNEVAATTAGLGASVVAGWYCFNVLASLANAVNSIVYFQATLQVRQV